MPNYISALPDQALISTGDYFWCEVCFITRPNSEQSPKPGQCQCCYDIIREEHITRVNTNKTAWDIIPPEVSDVPAQAQDTSTRRGPKQRCLPVDRITQLSASGLSSREIAGEISSETGQPVSYKTIQRILSGKRKEAN